ncbi:MAG: hypothetical protein U0Y68_15510 [Blastocatellia bacterium]
MGDAEAQQIITINDPVTGYYYGPEPAHAYGGQRWRHSSAGEGERAIGGATENRRQAKRSFSGDQTMKAIELNEEMKRWRVEKQQAMGSRKP